MRAVSGDSIVDVARDPRFWQGFQGLCLTRTGRLVLGIKRAYGHGASRWSEVWVQASDDHGRTWAQPRLLARSDFRTDGRCVATGGVYVTALRSGRLLLHHDEETWPERSEGGTLLHISDDDGHSWQPALRLGGNAGLRGDGCILELSDGTLVLNTQPGNRLFRSRQGGEDWTEVSRVLTDDLPLRLGEVCLSELHDGRIVMLMRENTYANFPAFAVVSNDRGRTWEPPRPTPFVAHWPSSFALPDGRHLIAYRNVGGRANSVVWCGDLGALPGYRVSSCRYGDTDAATRFTEGGLVLDTDGDRRQFAQFYLMPTDTSRADVTIEAEVRCLANRGHACAVGIRGCGWLRIFPDHLDVEHIPGDSVRKLDGTVWHTYRFERRRRSMRICVDGDEVLAVPAIELAPPAHAPCNAFGAKFDYRSLPLPQTYPMRVRLPAYVRPSNSGCAVWRAVRMDIIGNEWLPDVHYDWEARRDGLPDRWQEENLLELDACRNAGDWGKPVVVCGSDGECFAVDYASNDAPVGFPALAWAHPGRGCNSYVEGFRFQLDDIPSS